MGFYKTELVRHRGPWRGLDDLELATLEWVDWFNHQRLFHDIVRVPPADYKAAHHRQQLPTDHRATHTDQPASKPVRFTCCSRLTTSIMGSTQARPCDLVLNRAGGRYVHVSGADADAAAW